MERMTPNRPLTHDLFKSALETFGVELQAVVINNLLDGIFYSQLLCVKNGETVEIDSRTSDALAMAVRFSCPIYTYEFILDAAGVILEDSDGDVEPEDIEKPTTRKKSKRTTKSNSGNALNQYSVEDLSKMLDDVLAAEDYEKAAAIRDEIKRRGSK
jgi:bifunctional DNase/RNase